MLHRRSCSSSSWRRSPRSGILGLGVGALVLLGPVPAPLVSRRPARAALARRRAARRARGLLAAALLPTSVHPIAARRPSGALDAPRTSTSTTSSRTCCTQHPLFGLGLNNFSVYYEFVTGKTNWGPHSFYVGAARRERARRRPRSSRVFLWYLFRTSRRGARSSGAALAAAGDPLAARLRPLAWG